MKEVWDKLVAPIATAAIIFLAGVIFQLSINDARQDVRLEQLETAIIKVDELTDTIAETKTELKVLNESLKHLAKKDE